MNALVLYDGHAEGWSAEDVRQVLEVVQDVRGVLERAAHAVTVVPVKPGVDWLAACAAADVLVNLCEGLGGVSRFEGAIAGAMELLGVPVTGATARTITLCHDKSLVNALLESYGLPVPTWTTADRGIPADFPLPAFVKPAAEDASVGIDQGSVVTDAASLAARVETLRHDYGPTLVQQYVPGREIAVGFLGDDVLPLSEIDYSAMPAEAWPILTFDAKWTPESPEDLGSQPVCPADIDQALADRIIAVATRAWGAVGGSGYGRVDLRIDAANRPWIIEVNPNPDISRDAGLARMAHAAGLDYDDLILAILAHAVAAPGSAVRSAPQAT